MKSPDELYENVQKLINSDSQKEAIEALERLLESFPDYAAAHNDLGVLHANDGNKDKALFHYKKAAELQPENLIFQRNLAGFYCAQPGGMEEAMQIYLKVLEANPTDVETLVILGHICLSMEKQDDAKVFFDKVLEVEPWNADAREGLEQIVVGREPEVGGQKSEGRRDPG